MTTVSLVRLNEISGNFMNKTIAVIGDVMLDRYFWGEVSRVSPEAPVPVVDLNAETYHLGGAANAASNLNSLGMFPLLCGQIGDDPDGVRFEKIAVDDGMIADGLYKDPTRPTTVKTRIFGNNQQLVRLDTEATDQIRIQGEAHILQALNNHIDISAVLFCDYNKGTLNNTLIREVVRQCNRRNIPVFVDPKYTNFFDYTGVTLFKPNKKEAEQALIMNLDSEEAIRKAGKILLERLKCENVLLTLGSEGMMLFESNGNISSIPTNARHVSDVSGAGDTVISTFAAAMVGGASPKEAAVISNQAAGIVCEQPGIVSIELNELKAKFE